MRSSSLCLAVKQMKKKEEEMSLTVALPDIPEELLIEILTRLPVKSLMRYKCVSKLWLSLITSRYFTDLFLKSSSHGRRFFAYLVDQETRIKYALLASSSDHDHSDTTVSVIDQDLAMSKIEGRFVSVARGLACFTSQKSVRISNLHTRQVVELPELISATIVNNNMSNYFGHDPVNDEYKVLSVVWDFSNEEGVLRSEHQVLFNLIELPNEIPYWWYYSFKGFIIYKGKLALFTHSSNLSYSISEVWVLEDAKKSQWFEKKTFVLPVSLANQRICVTSGSNTVWFRKVDVKPNQATRFFIYDPERNDSTQSIEIRPFRGSFKKTNWLFSSFWYDIENIMYLEI
ncbi:putative F-box protein At3g52320 [Eutrema salsugineum]|uniref:putative F-box protein At3g52320 n=1 Tax=Eutrema salsugineum TaxID=72664 RepID=UPI000CED02AC|nr:putative F-box protein At3g52320 [Eutrema salsugineum]